jgi:hypothetical protein
VRRFGIPNSWRESGLGLIEGLIAISIVVLAMLIAIPAFHKTYQIVNDFERKGKCERAFLGATNAIELTPPEYRTTNVHHGYWKPEIRSSPVVLNRFSDLAYGLPSGAADFVVRDRFAKFGIDKLYEIQPGHAVGDGSGNVNATEFSGVRLYTPLLLAGSMGYLADLYNGGACADYIPAPNFIKAAIREPNINLFMRVRRQNLITKNVENACPAFWPRSKNQFGRETIYEPYTDTNYDIASYDPGGAAGGKVWVSSDYGFQVDFRGEVVNSGTGAVESTCEIGRTFTMPFDFQNVMDFLEDLKVVRWSMVPPPTGSYRDWTHDFGEPSRGLVRDKRNKFLSVSDNLKTVYTNFYTKTDGNEVKDRPICSQTRNERTAFTISFEIRNLSKEPGVVAMCLDTSKNWLQRAGADATDSYYWCKKSTAAVTDSVSVNIVNDDRTFARVQGWVPCEDMHLCHERPLATRVVKLGDDSVRYEYDYSISNGLNDGSDGFAPSRLWGCEMKFGVALVDPAGNMSYVPNDALTDALRVADETMDQAVPSAMREINPKIYPRPPPCFLCNCKACKGKSLFGGFFKWLLLIILVVVTAGAATPFIAIPGMVGAITGIAALSCLSGNLGCEGGGGYTAPNFDDAKFLQCDDVNRGICKCGQKCNRVKSPGPTWIDRLDGDPDDDTASSSQCKPESKVIKTSLKEFTALLSYKTLEGTRYKYFVGPDEILVDPGDEVMWEEFDPATGIYCFAVYHCKSGAAGAAGTWAVSQETVDDINGNSVTGNLQGCYYVKVGSEANWSASPDGTKPGLGAPVCLYPNFYNGGAALPTNPSGEPLMGYADIKYECWEDTGSEALTPVPPVGAKDNKRYFGNPLEQCSKPYTYETTTVRPATPEKKLTSCGDSGDCFECWKECRPPLNSPFNPFAGTEMMYYQPYTAAAGSLPWCVPNNTSSGGTTEFKVFDKHP